MAEKRDAGTIYIENNQDDGDIMTEILELPNSDGDTLTSSFVANLKTFGDVWKATLRKDSSIYTAINYLRGMGKALGGKDPADWTEDDFQSFMLSDTYRDWAPSTKQTARSFLKAYLEVLGRREMLLPNLYHFWKAKSIASGGSNRYDTLKSQAPTVAEVDRVLETCRDAILNDEPMHVYRHMALYLAAAYGLRSIEVAQMRLCDIDVENNSVHIEKSKGDKSRDVFMDVPITEEMWSCFMAARSLIIASLLESKSESDVAKLTSLDDRAAPLFFKRLSDNGCAGEPLTPKAMGGIYRRLGDRIIGRHVNPHAYRHAKAFHLLEVARIDPHQAKVYLGHCNLDQTLAYVYSGVDEQRAAFAAVGAAPAPAPSPAPSGKLDAAVAALTAAYSRGDLSADAFAAAVAALSSGSA